MVQDIFIDTNIACKFARPSSESVKFLEWLSAKGYLVVSKKLLVEYNKTCNIQLFSTVINKLTIDKRIVVVLLQVLLQVLLLVLLLVVLVEIIEVVV